MNPRFQNNLRTKYEQCGKNLILYFGLIDERMNHSGNKQPVTKSELTCKPTLKSSEVKAFVSILRHKILMKYIGMRPQFRKAVALIKERIQITFALICIILH